MVPRKLLLYLLSFFNHLVETRTINFLKSCDRWVFFGVAVPGMQYVLVNLLEIWMLYKVHICLHFWPPS